MSVLNNSRDPFTMPRSPCVKPDDQSLITDHESLCSFSAVLGEVAARGGALVLGKVLWVVLE
jgi:hypothetical protein